MKISELIAQLETIKQSHGDLPVDITIAEYYEGETGNAKRAVVGQDHTGATVVAFEG